MKRRRRSTRNERHRLFDRIITRRRLSVDSAPLSSFITYTHDIITGGDSLAKWTAAGRGATTRQRSEAPQNTNQHQSRREQNHRHCRSIYILFTRLIIRSTQNGQQAPEASDRSSALLLNALRGAQLTAQGRRRGGGW